jgi:hypothetical protein
MDAKTPRRPLRNDLDQFRLRTFLEGLGSDELQVIDTPTKFSEVAQLLHGNPKAVWFKQAGDSGLTLVGNVAASRSRMA